MKNTMMTALLIAVLSIASMAQMQVSGRVTNESGRPISNVRITASPNCANQTFATTNGFGYYQLTTTGECEILSIRATAKNVITFLPGAYTFWNLPSSIATSSLEQVNFTAID